MPAAGWGQILAYVTLCEISRHQSAGIAALRATTVPAAGWGQFVKVPNGLVAIPKVPAAGWSQILADMTFGEISRHQSASMEASRATTVPAAVWSQILAYVTFCEISGQFTDVPTGLVAITKVPAAGWGQTLADMTFGEISLHQSASMETSRVTTLPAAGWGQILAYVTFCEISLHQSASKRPQGRLR